jgi:hypothetical protein
MLSKGRAMGALRYLARMPRVQRYQPAAQADR